MGTHTNTAAALASWDGFDAQTIERARRNLAAYECATLEEKTHNPTFYPEQAGRLAVTLDHLLEVIDRIGGAR